MLSKVIKAKSKNEVGEISGLLPPPLKSRKAGGDDREEWNVQRLKGVGSARMEMD